MNRNFKWQDDIRYLSILKEFGIMIVKSFKDIVNMNLKFKIIFWWQKF